MLNLKNDCLIANSDLKHLAAGNPLFGSFLNLRGVTLLAYMLEKCFLLGRRLGVIAYLDTYLPGSVGS